MSKAIEIEESLSSLLDKREFLTKHMEEQRQTLVNDESKLKELEAEIQEIKDFLTKASLIE